MKQFAYHRPQTLQEAWRLQDQSGDACFLAGGTLVEASDSAILASQGLDKERDENTIFLFAGIDKARFKRQLCALKLLTLSLLFR